MNSVELFIEAVKQTGELPEHLHLQAQKADNDLHHHNPLAWWAATKLKKGQCAKCRQWFDRSDLDERGSKRFCPKCR